MFERFTDRARRVVVLAQEEARLLNHNYIGTEHILLGLIHEGDGVAARALELCDVSLDQVRAQVTEVIGTGPIAPSAHIPFTPRAKAVLELSLRESLQLGHNYIGTEHILLGLLREADGVGAQVLNGLGVDLGRVRQAVIELLSGHEPGRGAARGGFRDLSQTAVIGVGGTEPPFMSRGTPMVVSSTRAGPVPAGCSFCGRPSPMSGRLFSGSDGALICEQCARLVVEQLPESGRLQWSGPPQPPDLEELVAAVEPTGPPPEDEESARAEIERVFLAWGDRSEDGRDLVNVQDGADLGVYLDDIQRRYSAAQNSSLVVDAIVFVSSTEAVVFTTTNYQGSPLVALQHKEGRAVLVEGRWLTTRETIAERLSYIGVRVPPRADDPSSPSRWIASARPGVYAPMPRPAFVPRSGSYGAMEPSFDALAARYEQSGPPPGDEESARDAVEAAFRNLNARTADGRGLVNVEHGEELGAPAARVEDRVNLMAMHTVNVVEHLKFLDAEHAVVWLTTMLLDGPPMLGPIRRRECRAVLVDGRWNVAYESVRELWALADVQIPPHGDRGTA